MLNFVVKENLKPTSLFIGDPEQTYFFIWPNDCVILVCFQANWLPKFISYGIIITSEY